jgi:serine O-acetyltransferase
LHVFAKGFFVLTLLTCSKFEEMNQNLNRLLEILDHSHAASFPMPNVQMAQKWTDLIYQFLFPTSGWTQTPPSQQFFELQKQLVVLLAPVSEQSEQISDQFFFDLSAVHAKLQLDLSAFLQSDPAAMSTIEVVSTYPGFYALAVHRVAHALHMLRVPLLPRICAEYAHSRTGIDIHPGAQIGEAFFIDHGTGVVIGETCLVGNHVKVYQGVTLGALQVHKAMAGTKRHPSIGDHVVIYANATILGGNTIIGHHSVIGGNAWITKSVDAWSVVQHKSDVQIRSKNDAVALNFVI